MSEIRIKFDDLNIPFAWYERKIIICMSNFGYWAYNILSSPKIGMCLGLGWKEIIDMAALKCT